MSERWFLTAVMQKKEKKNLVSTVLLIQKLSNLRRHNPHGFIARDQDLLVLQKTETQGDYSDTKVMPSICVPAICITLEVENKGNAELCLF